MSQDRPDLIESELSGLAFDSNQQVFKSAHIEIMFSQPPPSPVLNEPVYTFIDPAAGGPQSDYAVLSVTRHKGLLTVSLLAAEIGVAQAVHEGRVVLPAVLDPLGDQVLAQGVVEAVGLVGAQAAHQEHARLPSSRTLLRLRFMASSSLSKRKNLIRSRSRDSPSWGRRPCRASITLSKG